MSSIESRDIEDIEGDENASPNVNANSRRRSPKSFKKLLSPEEDSSVPVNAASYLQKVGESSISA